MRIKVCGITCWDDARRAAELGVDFVGLIRARSSRRASLAVTVSTVIKLPPGGTAPVLLYRNTPLDAVLFDLNEIEAKWVQLHGQEPVSYVRELCEARPDLHVIRAWEVESPAAGDRLEAYLAEAREAGVSFEAVILDTPKSGPHPGYACLGEISRRFRDSGVEFWCAGGLSAMNVAKAVGQGEYAGVDVCRGVERMLGTKDPEELERFVSAVRALG